MLSKIIGKFSACLIAIACLPTDFLLLSSRVNCCDLILNIFFESFKSNSPTFLKKVEKHFKIFLFLLAASALLGFFTYFLMACSSYYA